VIVVTVRIIPRQFVLCR